MILDTTVISKAQQQAARVLGISLSDGLGAGRLEPIVDGADWVAGMTVTLWAAVRDASETVVARWQGTISNSFDRLGNAISSSLSILAPFPSTGYTLDVGFSADRVANIGLRLTAAPDPSQLPAPLAPPGGA